MRSLITVLLVVAVVRVQAQEYQVLLVKGEIILTSNGSVLKPGDKISENENIQFKTIDAMAAVLSSEKGRYILKTGNETSDQSDLIYVLKSTVSPVRGGMSTRAGGINNSMDLKFYFAEAPYVWAGDLIRVMLSLNAFPMNEQHYFFIQYVLNGEVINKKLANDDDILIIDKNTLFRVDGNPVNPGDITSYRLYYFNAKNEESELIAEIDFVLIDKDSLQRIFDEYKNFSENPYYDIAEIFSNFYGKCDPLQLRYNIED